MSKALLNSISLLPALAAGLMGQTPGSATALSFTNQAIESLRDVSKELTASVKVLYQHLDETLARQDTGYQSERGRQVQAADADLNNGPADLMWTGSRRLAAFRIIYARKQGYEPNVVADLDRIQHLILEARKRVDASAATPRRLLVVAVAELDRHNDAALKSRHALLLKTRAATEEAATQALLALPIELPEADSPDEAARQAWDSLLASRRTPEWSAGAAPQTLPAVPIRFERRKRVTLINEISYRMAITDSGIEDRQGRHIFYQEEWVQRGPSVIRLRWRVAVETATGEHILLKRYPPLELRGSLEDLYSHRDRGYLWYLEPPDDSVAPTREEMENALVAVTRSREKLLRAARDFTTGVREALAKQDQLRAAAKEPAIDSGLPDGLRQTLFAIRAHVSGVAATLKAEDNVRRAVSQADQSIRDLEPVAAWSNRGDDGARFRDRAEREIDFVRTVQAEALAFLPPAGSRAEENFPALEKNVIVRIRPARSKYARNAPVRCLQEIWRMESRMPGTREVMRTVTLILIDPRTGNQVTAGARTILYAAPPGNLLEEIFDEYAADDITFGS